MDIKTYLPDELDVGHDMWGMFTSSSHITFFCCLFYEIMSYVVRFAEILFINYTVAMNEKLQV